MELRVLKYYLTAAQEENISRAADILHVTQPTLSRQLADLEHELGVKLFHRGNRHITLTDSGLLLRRRAEEVLTLIDKIEQEIRMPGDQIDGTVSIGSAEAAATEILPPLLRDFSEKYPQVRYELFTGNADIIKERIDKGLLDVDLLTEPVELSRYDFLRLREQGLCHAFALECALPRYPNVSFIQLAPELITSSVLVWKRRQASSEAVRRFIREIMVRFGDIGDS